MKKLLLLMLVVVMLSCTKKVTETEYVEVDKDSWKIDQRMQGFDQQILNTYILGDQLLFITPQNRGYLSLSSNSWTTWVCNSEINYLSKPHMNQNYLFAATEGNEGIVAYAKDLPAQGSLFEYNGVLTSTLTPAMLDSTLKHAEICSYGNMDETIMSNGDKQFIFFFRNYSSESNDPNTGTFYCLIDFSVQPVENYENYKYSFRIDRAIIRKIVDHHDTLSGLYYFNSKYFVSCSGNFTVNANGDMSSIPIRYYCTSFVEYQNKLWTISNSKFWNTSDGINWTETEFSVPQWMHCFEFDGRLCGFLGTEIFEISLEGQLFYLLDNSGLDAHTVTSINKTSNMVYISTPYGLYSRLRSDFFKNKTVVQINKK